MVLRRLRQEFGRPEIESAVPEAAAQANQRVAAWLKSWRLKQCAVTLAGAGGGLVLGIVVLFVTFWVTYVVIEVGRYGISAALALAGGPRVAIGHHWRLALSGVFVILLMIESARSENAPPGLGTDDWPEYADSTWQLRHLRAEWNLVVHPVESAERIAYWLRLGPKTLYGSVRLCRKFVCLLRLRTERLAPVLAYIASKPTSVSKDELGQVFPQVEWEELIPELALIDEIQFLRPDLTRFTVTESLRREFADA